ncbi:hypothetical protein PYW07_002126 [Mythimna separata]|uniref:Uncharacterized protein n=2 Tax=Mythimna TaxID=103830 RepID=A0AAD7YLQ6_MYTSE|nr:hypothetical protein PYW07_002126 [Mythimna separata]KAJ8730635.1 hypothetical protein PYW08_002048 [Mythimna loreyi]
MFDVVFIFFLFLIAVTCVMNYMPGRSKRSEVTEDEVDDDVIPPPPLFAGDDDEVPTASRDTISTDIIYQRRSLLRRSLMRM